MGRARLALIGFHRGATGAGLIHQQLARWLPEELGPDYAVTVMPERPSHVPAPIARRLLTAVPPLTDLALTTSTPLPLRPGPAPLLSVVYDVRWHWTRPLAARLYRQLDFHRTTRRAVELLTVSGTAAAQIQLLGRNRAAVTVLPMGPGQFEGYPQTRPHDEPWIVLMGRAAHKRNELAARLLVASDLVRRDFRVTAVSVSAEAAAILRRGLRPAQLEVVDDVAARRLAEILEDAAVYVALGDSEGFGFPYVEAAYFGCDVVAPPLPLTREVLGDDANFLPSTDPSVEDLEGALRTWDRPRVEELQWRAVNRSWRRTARLVADRVRAQLVRSGSFRSSGQRPWT